MNVDNKQKKDLFAGGYLLFIFTGGNIVGIYGIYDAIISRRLSANSIFLFLFIIVSSFFIWFMVKLIRSSYYSAEFNDSEFLYKFLISKKYKYSDIRDLSIIKMKTKDGTPFTILKIKLGRKKNIRLRLDKLESSQIERLMNILKLKTGRKYIITKDKKNSFFPSF